MFFPPKHNHIQISLFSFIAHTIDSICNISIILFFGINFNIYRRDDHQNLNIVEEILQTSSFPLFRNIHRSSGLVFFYYYFLIQTCQQVFSNTFPLVYMNTNHRLRGKGKKKGRSGQMEDKSGREEEQERERVSNQVIVRFTMSPQILLHSLSDIPCTTVV